MTDGFAAAQDYVLVGVPHAKSLSHSAKDVTVPPEGHLHCGCNIDVVLLDFFFWKTWTLNGVVGATMVTESLQGDLFSPRHRAFIAKAFIEATGLTVDDLYSSDIGTFNYGRAMAFRQLEALLRKINNINAIVGSPMLGLTDIQDDAMVIKM
jgi:hypothetical protein